MTYVLLYHDIATPADRDAVGFPGSAAARYKLEPALFEAHLEAIARTGVEVGLVDSGGTFPAAALSFDDAGASALSAADRVEARGWRGHFFVPTAKIGEPGFLGPEELRELAARGHAIGSHSHTHPAYMGRLPRAEVLEEWSRSREVLGELLGEAPAIASVPGGSLSSTVVECVRACGYSLLMTSEPSSRVSRADGLSCIGRYGIWATTTPERAASYVRGATIPRARLWLSWNAKKLAKRIDPGLYERARGARNGR
jgi:peptidoglycan/xylan/chitin deacetylase (PgdA/CDA1 family)